MVRWFLGIPIFVLLGQGYGYAEPSPQAEARAVLSKHCFACHASTTMSGLDLRSREAILKGGSRGAALKPGNAEESLLYQVVAGGGELRMPMGRQRLEVAEVAAIRDWIDQGAPWEDATAEAVVPQWWSFRNPAKPAIPGDTENPVDAFIDRKLEGKGLRALPPADRRTLIRRAYFDLHGLPPPPEEVDAFVNDSSEDAFSKLVDRLLASPRYGERWGRYWLDAVRYADTGGFETDIYFPNAWRYRDYVIQSFNKDKPYNRFVKEQIAGDEIWPDDLELRGGYQIPEKKLEHLEARIGTGMYTIGPVYHEAALDGRQLRYEWMTDAVDTTSEVFLGLTMGCARCHDHKFDPISQRDYHRMMAVFAGSEIREVATAHKMNVFGFYSGYPKLLKVEDLQAAIRKIDAKARRRATERVESGFSPGALAAYKLSEEKRSPEQRRLAAKLEAALTEAGLKENPAGIKPKLEYTKQEIAERELLIGDLGKAALAARFSKPTATVLGHAEVDYPMHMTSRGDFRPAGDRVSAGFPATQQKLDAR